MALRGAESGRNKTLAKNLILWVIVAMAFALPLAGWGVM